jgi:hypothetical protein
LVHYTTGNRRRWDCLSFRYLVREIRRIRLKLSLINF